MVAWACLLIVYVVWGSTYLAIRVGVQTMPPLLMAATRNLVAGLILFPVALLARRGRRPASRRRSASGIPAPCPRPASSIPAPRRWPGRAEWLGCAVVGVLLLVANAVVGIGEQTAPSGLAALLVATVPLWLIGIDAVLNHARIGLAPAAGLALGLAGVALLSGVGGGSEPISAGGVVIILAAAAMWAAGTIMARRVTLPRSAALASGMQLLCGGVTLLVLAAATGELGSLRLGEVPARSWLALGYLIVAVLRRRVLRLRHRGPDPAHRDGGHLRVREPGDRGPARHAHPERAADPGHARRRRAHRGRRGPRGAPQPARTLTYAAHGPRAGWPAGQR